MTTLTSMLEDKGRLITTEFLPPKAASLSGLVQKVLRVADVVDSVSFPELKANQRSRPRYRMNPFYVALRIRDLTGVETLFHLTPRDYNRNAVAGLLTSAAEAGMRNILVVGGDRYSPEEMVELSKNVYDFKGSTEMIRGIRFLEEEFSLGESAFCILGGTDPSVVYTRDKTKIDREITRLIEQQDAGADMAQTQPVFDMQYFDFVDAAREQGLKIPILPGILPLRGGNDCEEIEKRYGITIPGEVKSLVRRKGEECGTQIAYHVATDLVKNGVRALHIYPRENPDLVLEVAKLAMA